MKVNRLCHLRPAQIQLTVSLINLKISICANYKSMVREDLILERLAVKLYLLNTKTDT